MFFFFAAAPKMFCTKNRICVTKVASFKLPRNSLNIIYLTNAACKDVGNTGGGGEASGVIPLGVSSGVDGRNELSVHRKRPSKARGVDHPRIGLPRELPGEDPSQVGGVREPLDHRIARAADAVAREKDRVDSWNLLPSGYFRLRWRVCRAEG